MRGLANRAKGGSASPVWGKTRSSSLSLESPGMNRTPRGPSAGPGEGRKFHQMNPIANRRREMILFTLAGNVAF